MLFENSIEDILTDIEDIFIFKSDESNFDVHLYRTPKPDLVVATIYKSKALDYSFTVDEIEYELEHLQSYLGVRLQQIAALYVHDSERQIVGDWRDLRGQDLMELSFYFIV